MQMSLFLFVSIRKLHHHNQREHNSAATQNPRLIYMYAALVQEHKGVPMLELAPEPEDLKKEPELMAILPAPKGGGNLFDQRSTVGQGGPIDGSAR